MKDYYVCDPTLNSGYYGAVEYRIPAGWKKNLSSSKFARKLIEEKKPQEIHVKSSSSTDHHDKTLLVLHHDDFQNIKAIYLEMKMWTPAISPFKDVARFVIRNHGC
ncbi:hypothetical protein BUALT_Bualt10G0087500 [Buddleja alternifolia]|uniref:Uncharacterized protein n=1 Tax=Buddleja alternifolia TaxID=168488 RepID=A0AAV6X850_9LAMI|nr:hypothetical protein BUALT_Bualt10G0087500 [Buddleja alternifolia]